MCALKKDERYLNFVSYVELGIGANYDHAYVKRDITEQWTDFRI